MRLSVWWCILWLWHRRNLLGYKGYRYPHFLDWGYRTPTFQDEKVKNLLSPTVNRGDLRGLNYNILWWIKIFIIKLSDGVPPHPTPLGELTTLSQTSESDKEGYFLPILLPFRLETKERLVLLLNWYPYFSDQSYAPDIASILWP